MQEEAEYPKDKVSKHYNVETTPMLEAILSGRYDGLHVHATTEREKTHFSLMI
jgi:hypothetical protein